MTYLSFLLRAEEIAAGLVVVSASPLLFQLHLRGLEDPALLGRGTFGLSL